MHGRGTLGEDIRDTLVAISQQSSCPLLSSEHYAGGRTAHRRRGDAGLYLGKSVPFSCFRMGGLGPN